MTWYRTAQIDDALRRVARMVSEMGGPETYELMENAEALHELEYKAQAIMRKAAGSPFVHPKRLENIIARITSTAWEYFEACKEGIETAYGDWNAKHQIESADRWAEMVWESIEETSDDPMESFQERGIQWGGIGIDSTDVLPYVDASELKSAQKEDVYSNVEAYEYDLDDFLNKHYKDWKRETVLALEYVEEHDLADEFAEWWVENRFDPIEYMRDVGFQSFLTEWDVKKAIAGKLYPAYMANWGGAVKGIKEDIKEAEKKLDSITYEDNISQMTAAVSLALNVMHVGGNITGEYFGFGLEALDRLSNLEVDEWDEEIKEEFRI